jgi:mercuric ion transport protein
VTALSCVELIFDATCPNVDAARIELRAALARAGRPMIWTEWDRGAANAPAHVRQYASPTVLVAGRDVAAGSVLDAGSGCRVYTGARGVLVGAPSADTILAALRHA